MKTVLRFVVIYVLVSVALGVLTLVSSFPTRPTSWLGWLALFALALPLTLLGELVGELLNRNRIAHAVQQHAKGVSFSWLRLFYLLVVCILVAAAVVGLNLFSG